MVGVVSRREKKPREMPPCLKERGLLTPRREVGFLQDAL